MHDEGGKRMHALTRPTNVVYDLKKDYGLEVSYRVAWLGVEKARGEMFGAHSISFDQLRWYNIAVMENNPGSYINIDYDQHNNRFLRKFKGNLLAATVKDGNQGLFPLAIAIVDSENTTNWSWFLGQLAHVVDDRRTLMFVTDRHTGLLESIPIIFPTSHHAFCLQHLQGNLQDKLRHVNSSYRARMLTKFCACAYAPTVVAFNQSMEDFIKCGCKANAYFRSGTRYGEMSSNAVESFNSWIREARHLQITQMINSIQTKIMRQMAKRRCKAQAWRGVVCSKMEDRLWKMKGFPCAHVVVAIRNSGRNLYDLVAPYYYVTAYQNSYAYNINPIPTVEKPPFRAEDFVIQPSAVKRPPGRPKKKRMLSKGEQVQ
ncbi:hypothetical protein ACSBR1_035064 [Camellia fascicularis]